MFIVEVLFIVPTKMISDKQDEIVVLTNSVADLQLNNNNLASETNRLQHNLNEDETALKVVAIITGTTNSAGSVSENADKILLKVNSLQQKLTYDEAVLLGNRKEEIFRLSDTNRAVVYIPTNHGPYILFKLKHTPIFNTIQGMVHSDNASQMPLLINGQSKNVIWLMMSGQQGLENMTFSFVYAPDTAETNAFDSLSIIGGLPCFDHIPTTIADKQDE